MGLFTDCDYIMDCELFYSVHDQCFNYSDLFCGKERERNKEILDLCTINCRPTDIVQT